MRVWVVLALAAAAIAGPAWPADVNAPIDTRPTLQTEMHRGFAAADKCPITLDPLDYDLCIDRISTAEGALLANADPFNLGLFLAAWVTHDLVMTADASTPDNPVAQADLPASRDAAAHAFGVVRGLQQKIGLTDRQVMAASGVRPGALNERWTYWEAQRAAKETAEAPSAANP